MTNRILENLVTAENQHLYYDKVTPINNYGTEHLSDDFFCHTFHDNREEWAKRSEYSAKWLISECIGTSYHNLYAHEMNFEHFKFHYQWLIDHGWNKLCHSKCTDQCPDFGRLASSELQYEETFDDNGNYSIYAWSAFYGGAHESLGNWHTMVNDWGKTQIFPSHSELDKFDQRILLEYFFEQLDDRFLTIYRFPNSGAGHEYGLGSDWIVQFKSEFAIHYRPQKSWIMQRGDWAVDTKICRRFENWHEAIEFYEEMRNMNLLEFQNLGKKKTTKQIAKKERQTFRQERYSSGDHGINWRSVAELDNWICYLCGGPVDQIGGTPKHRRGATMEHILPLAEGGPHTWNNVKCAHWECNMKKGKRI